MKKITCVTVLASITLFMLPPVAFSGKSSPEMGRQFFTDQKFGGSPNEKSCNSCHANGKNLETAADNPQLTSLINKCITNHMEGQKIDGRSMEIRSVKMYIKSLAK
jgi:cytochrome c553